MGVSLFIDVLQDVKRTKAKNILGWEAKLDLYKMCHDSWLWQKQNPNGI